MDEQLKRTVEAILFAAARKLELAEIAKLGKSTETEVLQILNEWKKQLDETNSPTMLIQDGTAWKLTIREKYISVIRKVVTQTELPKSLLETLAVVAYKVPVLQSKVIKIRTNKAYDHLSQLEKSGFITREKQGRTKLIKLTPKFFEYFDLSQDQLKNKFKNSEQIEQAIEAKEKEIEQTAEQQRKQTKENLEAPQVVLQTEKGPKVLETYPVIEKTDIFPTGVQVFMEKIGDLEVYDAKPEAKPKEEKQRKRKPEKIITAKPEIVEEKIKVVEEIKPVEEKVEVVEEKPAEKLTPEKIAKEAAEKAATLKSKNLEEGKGLFPEGIPPEVEQKIEERIKKIMAGEKKEEE